MFDNHRWIIYLSVSLCQFNIIYSFINILILYRHLQCLIALTLLLLYVESVDKFPIKFVIAFPTECTCCWHIFRFLCCYANNPLLLVWKGIELEIVNSCEKNNGGCSHHCEHALGGPRCSCNHGYQLDADEKTCIGNVWETLFLQSGPGFI